MTDLTRRTFGVLVTASLLMVSVLIAHPANAQPGTDPVLSISNQFKFADKFSDDHAVIQTNSGWGLIGSDGEIVLEPNHKSLRTYSNGLVAFLKNDRWGFKNSDGTTVIPPNYQDVTDFSNGLAAVQKNDRWGYVDPEGNTTVPFQFEKAWGFKNGLARVTKNERSGFINKSGTFIVHPRFNDAHSFSHGLVPVEQSDLWGYVDRNGQWKINNRFTWAYPFNNRRARVMINGLWGMIDRNGTVVDTYPFEFLHNFHENRALFRNHGRVGYIGPDGDTVIPAKFDRGNNFNQGLAAVQKDDKWGFIDRAGNWVLQPQYQLVSNFSDSYAAVKINRRWGYIFHPNSNGNHRESAEIHQPSERIRNVDESILEDFPLNRQSPNKRYVSIGKGLTRPEWHRAREDEINTYQRSMLIYEVNRFPYQLPTHYQRAAAHELYLRSLEAARSNEWFNKEKSRDDGYVPNSPDASHFHNKSYVQNGETLVPGKPEYVIYNKDLDGDLKLSGYMFLMPSNHEEGPQVAGPLTQWHFHVYDEGRCFEEGSIILAWITDRSNCQAEEGDWLQKSTEMVHVWFVNHPDGRYGTRMDVRPAVFESYPFQGPD